MLGTITITPEAAAQINRVRTQRANPNLNFRIAVMGGGCSGFQYKMEFDETRNDWDLEFTQDGATVLVDDLSIQYIKDAELHFQKDLSGARFVIENPNASSGCGCGVSFAVKTDL